MKRMIVIMFMIGAFTILTSAITSGVPNRNIFQNGDKYVNVRDYGAKGNAETDDSPAINKAMTEAAKSGKTVFFPVGAYVMRSGVVVPAGVSVEGISGATTGPWQNIIEAQNDKRLFDDTRSPRLSGQGLHWVDEQTCKGSWIIVNHGLGDINSAPTFRLEGNNTLTRLGFVHAGNLPVSAEVGVYPPAIGVDINQMKSANGININDISLPNPHIGIAVYDGKLDSYDLDKAASGKLTGKIEISSISGAPIYKGIVLKGVSSPVVINNLQFNYAMYESSYVEPRWFEATDIEIACADDVKISNVLSFGAQNGLKVVPAFKKRVSNVFMETINIESQIAMTIEASGKYDLVNSYLFSLDFLKRPKHNNYSNIVIAQDSKTTEKAEYNFQNVFFQNGTSSVDKNEIIIKATVQGGAKILFENAMIWGWHQNTASPIIEFNHESGASSTLTFNNLSLSNQSPGKLISTLGSAYRSGDVTFNYCSLQQSVMNGVDSRIKFNKCSISNGSVHTEYNR